MIVNSLSVSALILVTWIPTKEFYYISYGVLAVVAVLH